MQRTLVLLKPDAIQRGLVGEVTARFERKGLKLTGMKMMALSDTMLEQHYSHIADKPFFPELSSFMKSSPVIAQCWEGKDAVKTVRNLCGPLGALLAALAMGRRPVSGAWDWAATRWARLRRMKPTRARRAGRSYQAVRAAEVQSTTLVRSHPAWWAAATAATALSWVALMAEFWLMARILGLGLTFGQAMAALLAPLGMVAVGGFGLYQLSLIHISEPTRPY